MLRQRDSLGQVFFEDESELAALTEPGDVGGQVLAEGVVINASE
ncbi:MAG: hypothetical protein AAF567_11755 [Actinomycetota bacterium]